MRNKKYTTGKRWLVIYILLDVLTVAACVALAILAKNFPKHASKLSFSAAVLGIAAVAMIPDILLNMFGYIQITEDEIIIKGRYVCASKKGYSVFFKKTHFKIADVSQIEFSHAEWRVKDMLGVPHKDGGDYCTFAIRIAPDDEVFYTLAYQYFPDKHELEQLFREIHEGIHPYN